MSELPASIHFFERGWLSSNNILLVDQDKTTLFDSGYVTHGDQTLALLHSHLHDRPLDLLYNTHLHSDHCGANALLTRTYPDLKTQIPFASAEAVAQWNPQLLSYEPTGQTCPAFTYDSTLVHDATFTAGDLTWRVINSPGHDPDSVMFFNEEHRILVSADALWKNGFGVVFPELEGEQAFEHVAQTLDLIQALQPAVVLPGHGPSFTDVSSALVIARKRLDGFINSPFKHASYAVKVLIKFKLLEFQQISSSRFMEWAINTPYFQVLHQRYWPQQSTNEWIEGVLEELERSGALLVKDGFIQNL